jgi:ParB-like chromosome segregation protein Spo0J
MGLPQEQRIPRIHWRLVEVELATIDLDDRFYCRSFPAVVPDRLRRSIAEVGIVQPVHLTTGSGERWRIVHGFRRCWAAAAVGSRLIPAFVPGEFPVQPRVLYEWTVLQDVGHRAYNRAEQALILRTLRDRFSASEEELAEWLRRMCGMGGGQQVKRLLRISELEPEVLELVAEGEFPDDVLDMLFSWSQEDRLAVGSLVVSLRLGVGHQRELVRLLDELAGVEGRTPAAILRDPEVAALLARKWTMQQKAQHLFAQLKARRHPLLTQMEQEFRDLVRALKLPRGVTLVHSPYFETDELELRVRARSPAEFRKAAEELGRVAQDPALQGLWEIAKRTA